MARALLAALVAGFLSVAPLPSGATETVAFVGALSGAKAALGRDQRDGFLLALAERHGRLGGSAVRLVEFDDRGEAANAKAIADRIVAQRISIVTGLTTRESALALSSALAGKPVVLLASGAVPISLAGEKCASNFFSTAPVEDVVHENAGSIARANGYRSVLVVRAVATQSLVDAAFKRGFSGSVSTATGANDALAHLRSSMPDAVYVALRGGELRAFLDAYDEAGFFRRTPLIVADEGALLAEIGDDFSGAIASARWAPAMEDARSMRFVAAFEKRYKRKPSAFGLQGYEAALALDAALRGLQGKTLSAAALGRALATAKYEGVTGPVRFAANGFAVTQWHAWEVFDDSSGSSYLAPVRRTLEDYVDPHGARCPRH